MQLHQPVDKSTNQKFALELNYSEERKMSFSVEEINVDEGPIIRM